MTELATLHDGDRPALAELAPVLRRAVDLDRGALARLLITAQTATALVRLPFSVLVSRTIESQRAQAEDVDRDVTVQAADTLQWLDGETADLPQRRDAEWRSGLPPRIGWRRIETLPDEVIRSLVRQGALALNEAAVREGLQPHAQPRAEVADALLDSVVLTVSDDDAGDRAEITLRALSALTRMGFLPRGGTAHIDVSGRWARVVGGYGTVFLERPGSGLGLLTR